MSDVLRKSKASQAQPLQGRAFCFTGQSDETAPSTSSLQTKATLQSSWTDHNTPTRLVTFYYPDSYRPFKKNPIPSIERRVASKLLAFHHAGVLPHPTLTDISDHPAHPALGSLASRRFTNLMFLSVLLSPPEVHLCTTQPPHLAKILRPLVGLTQHHVSNSSQFIEITRDLTLQPSDILISFDVVSLFTNVPTTETCLLVKDRLIQDLSLDDRTSLTPGPNS